MGNFPVLNFKLPKNCGKNLLFVGKIVKYAKFGAENPPFWGMQRPNFYEFFINIIVCFIKLFVCLLI